jgi:YesN/AraC family two-component response regulator
LRSLAASNGYEALKIIDAEAPDLVMLDIWMPGIDGIETLKEIKKTSCHPAGDYHYRTRQRGNRRESD